MNSDFKDMLRLFAEFEVRYLLVGGYAVMHYAQPRFTKDIDLWLEPSPENAQKIGKVFEKFGIPLIDASLEDFEKEGFQYMVGRSPVLFDFLTSLPNLDFQKCWGSRELDDAEGFPVAYLSKTDLIYAKKQADRPQDRIDLEEIERAGEG